MSEINYSNDCSILFSTRSFASFASPMNGIKFKNPCWSLSKTSSVTWPFHFLAIATLSSKNGSKCKAIKCKLILESDSKSW